MLIRSTRKHTRGAAAALALSVFLAVPLVGATAEEAIDQDADKILKSMSVYLGSLKSYSVDFDADTEIMKRTGQKLQLSRSGSIVLERPGHLYATRKGADQDAEIYFDGKTLTFHGAKRKLYAQIDSPGTIDAAIDTAREEVGIDAPGADLLYSDAYSGLMLEAESGDYWGTTVVNGIESHHLSFRAKEVDWQIWVQTGDKPLPLKYVITSKWMAGAPQHSVRLYNWDVAPAIEAKRFEFTPPEGAKKVELISANELGEIETGEAE